MKKKNIWALACVFLMMIGILSGCGGGEEAAYPAEDISCLVPYAAGGGTDNIARAVAANIDLPAVSYTHLLEHFQHRIDSRPMAIISECRKGEGGFSKATESHKTTVGQDLAEWEIHQQTLLVMQSLVSGSSPFGAALRIAAYNTHRAIFIPVSYTHLDVYKRQAQWGAV